MRVVRKLARRHDRALNGRGAAWCPVLATIGGYAVLMLIVLTAGASARNRAAAITVRFVERQSVVQAGGVGAFSAHCPASAPHAVGPEFGAISAAAEGQLALAGSYPVGPGAWTVLVKNLSSQPQEYYSGITCVGSRGARFAAVRTSTVADPQQSGGALLRCPRSAPYPLNSTFQLQPGSAPGAAVADAALYEVRANKYDQISTMRNLTDAPVAALVGAECSSLAIHGPTPQSIVRPGQSDGFYSSCPGRGQKAIGGEMFPTNPNDTGTVVLTAFGVRNPGQWVVGVRNLSDRAITYDGGPVCVG